MIPKARRALWLLIALTAGLRLIWAATLSFGNDEAYHFLYAMHPDWSYFDHPPMTMLVERLGLALLGGGVSELSLRLGFVLLFAGSTWIMFRWTLRWYGEWAGFYAALALNLTAYYTAAAGAFVLPDGPLLFFSLLTMWRLSEAVVSDRWSVASGQWSVISGQSRSRRLSPPTTGHSPLTTGHWPLATLLPWVWVGLAWGAACLSKYHAIFLPAGALAVHPGHAQRAPLFADAGAVSRGLDRHVRLFARAYLEPAKRLGVVRVSGQSGRRLAISARRPGHGDRRAGPLSLALDLGGARARALSLPAQGQRSGRRREIAARRWAGAVDVFHGGGLRADDPAALDVDRLPAALPRPGSGLGGTHGRGPGADAALAHVVRRHCCLHRRGIRHTGCASASFRSRTIRPSR